MNELQPVSPAAPCYASPESLTHSCGRTELSPAQYTATGTTFPITSVVSRVPLHGLGQQTTLETGGTQPMPGLQPGCCVHPLHCWRLKCIEHHQETPTCACGRWHIPENLHLPGASKWPCKEQMPAQTQIHLVLPLQEDTDCGQIIPAAPSCRQHCPITKTLLLPRNFLPCSILITPFQLYSQSALSYWSQLLLHSTWQTAKHIPRGPSLHSLHLPAHSSLLIC